jgi:hypothetical protein
MVRNYPNDGKSNTTVQHTILPVFHLTFDSPGKLPRLPLPTELPIFTLPDSATISWDPLLLDTQVKSLLHLHSKKEVRSTTLEASSRHLSESWNLLEGSILRCIVFLV